MENKSFKILQLTDTHIGVLPAVSEDKKTYQMVEKIIGEESPDLIVHTGDIIWSEGIDNPEEIFIEFIDFLDSFNIPIAITFGNHDTEDNTSRSRLREIFDKRVKNKAKKTDSFIVDDKEAYTVKITDKGELVSLLYIIDSGDYDRLKLGLYDYVDPRHVERFRKTSNKYLKNDGLKRNIVFQHIPLPEYWLVTDKVIEGSCLETDDTISAPKINTGLFSNMLINGETWGISVGHDHDNNFLAKHQGLYLSFGSSTGFNAYGDLPKGASIFEIKKDPFEITKRNISYEP